MLVENEKRRERIIENEEIRTLNIHLIIVLISNHLENRVRETGSTSNRGSFKNYFSRLAERAAKSDFRTDHASCNPVHTT